jgi:hypothetical protein
MTASTSGARLYGQGLIPAGIASKKWFSELHTVHDVSIEEIVKRLEEAAAVEDEWDEQEAAGRADAIS